MMQKIWVFWGLTSGLLQAQLYECRVQQKVWGDYLYLTHEIRAFSGQSFPLGAANFILSWPSQEMPFLDWSQWQWQTQGPWDAHLNAHSYYSMDIRQKDSIVSLNILSRYGGSGVWVPDTFTKIATIRIPIVNNLGTSSPQFMLQGGEVLRWWKTPYKRYGSFASISPTSLCPTIEGFRIQASLHAWELVIPQEYFPDRLQFQWYRNGIPIATGVSFSPSEAGMYYAQVTHQCGSVGYSDTLWYRSMGISEREKHFWVYPNPASAFYFHAQNLSGSKITLYSSMGMVLKEIPISSMDWIYTWQPQELSAGVYVLKLETSEKIHYLRLVYVP